MRKWISPWQLLKKLCHALTGTTARAVVKGLIVRSYALLVLMLVLAAGYWAVHYLVRTVFYPPEVPVQILDWQGHLDVASLRTEQNEGVEQPAPRSPMGHYHRVDQWYQPDPKNGCTLSGCHEPLPHGKKSKVPAFANFHTTFLACKMCHAPQPHQSIARWVSTETNQPQDVPAILKLLNYLEQNTGTIQSQPAIANTAITNLLQQTIGTLGGDVILDQLLSQMQSTQPGSPVWKNAVTMLITELPQHARGEYRAKLDWKSDNRAAEYQTLSALARENQGRTLPAETHSSLAKEPARCVSCHDSATGMLDFIAAGYSPQRAKALSNLEVAKLIQHIREGQPFYLPNMEGAP